MTITNTTLASPTYNGNGSTTAFATGFQFISNSDLQVVVTDANGVETIKTITTHYTVTGAGVSGGGTVTFLTAPASGTFVNIKSNVTLDQQVDYVEGGAFSAATHETALDKLTKAVQQVKEITDRSLKLPISNQSITTQTSPITAGYILGVNDAGTALEWKTPEDVASGATISTFGASLVDDADAAAARTTLGLGSMSTQSSSSVSITGGTVSGITDITLADGGTGASLTDPNADRILFWDDSAGQVTWLTAGTNLTITGTTIDASGGGGGTLGVADGGTGVTSTTAYAVLCGGTTSTGALQSIASVGTSGHVLTSNGAGALPTFQASSAGTAATQSDQETSTSTTTFVSPGRQQYHPSASKAWGVFTSITTTTLGAGYNVTSLTDNGTGNTTVNLTTAFSSTNYCVVFFTDLSIATLTNTITWNMGSRSTGSFVLVSSDSGGVAQDHEYQAFTAFGDQ